MPWHRRGGACAGVNGERTGGDEGVAGGVRVFVTWDGEGFVFSFLNWVVRVFCPTKNFGGNGLLEPPVCD